MGTHPEGAFRTVDVPRATADVNVTPLIDVLLVLLIIFMATLPLTQRGLDVSLPVPEHRGPPPPPPPTTQVLLEYGADRRVTINTTPVELADLETRLREIFATRHDRTLFVRADGALRYGDVVVVIDAARGAGVTRVGVVTKAALAR